MGKLVVHITSVPLDTLSRSGDVSVLVRKHRTVCYEMRGVIDLDKMGLLGWSGLLVFLARDLSR
jgi:hypothetical protein